MTANVALIEAVLAGHKPVLGTLDGRPDILGCSCLPMRGYKTGKVRYMAHLREVLAIAAHGLVRDEPSEDERCERLPNPDSETCLTLGVGRDRACPPCLGEGWSPARSDDGRTAVEASDDQNAREHKEHTLARLRHDDGEANRG